MRGSSEERRCRFRRIEVDDMNEYQVVSLISLIGFLILIAGGFKSRKVNRRRTLYMAGAWAGIFTIVILFIDIVR